MAKEDMDKTTDIDTSALEEDLRAEGVRVTKQRLAILTVLAEAEDHPTAEVILERARIIDASISLATVYRTLNVLADKGTILKNEFDGSSARFELSNQKHHDHIIDIDSGEVIEFISAEIERLQEAVAAQYGFEIVSHRMELYCKRKRN